MMTTLPRPLRRLLAVSLLVAMLGAVVGVGIAPIAAHFGDLQSQIEQERLVLGHLLAATMNTPDIQQAARSTDVADTNRMALEGESDAIRAANLQSLVGAIASKHGLQMRSLRNLPPRERSELRMLGVQVQFIATIEQLRDALVAFEAQQPYLFVETLHISPLPGAMAVGSENPGGLDVRVDILAAAARNKG